MRPVKKKRASVRRTRGPVPIHEVQCLQNPARISLDIDSIFNVGAGPKGIVLDSQSPKRLLHRVMPVASWVNQRHIMSPILVGAARNVTYKRITQ